MKLNNTLTTKRNAGMTLLELTVVILVLLSLISILFVGARAWKKGSDRSANIMNIRNCQQAMRGAQNMGTLAEGTAWTSTELQSYMNLPTSPAPSEFGYTPADVITPQSPEAGATSYAHIWLVPDAAPGLPTGDYGQNAYTDSNGW